MLGVTSYEQSRNRKNLAASSSTHDNVDSHDKAEVCVYFHMFTGFIHEILFRYASANVTIVI